MKYRINYHASASSQVPGLPEDAFLALVRTLITVGDDPWSTGIPDPDDPDYRQAVFGGLGLVLYYVDDTAGVVNVYDVTWAG
ncbi:type II toxin-antitoxin system RelE/ParE family toxin [Sphaerimonospora cavernae]|uniref:Type II toxin-antitoxin system RelE/ParE family toxin n=1 Tax=Sphaerimonospora cavernae TaxID=1740611 RepID=A0ABV6U587_9ACTN